jgi:hypothetical protein
VRKHDRVFLGNEFERPIRGVADIGDSTGGATRGRLDEEVFSVTTASIDRVHAQLADEFGLLAVVTRPTLA